MTVETPPETSVHDLVERYDALLLDAYGVLVHSSGGFPGARELVEFLRDRDFPFWVVTNDASRLPSTAADKYRQYDIPIDPEQVITSGQLLEPYFEEHDLVGADCAVLGTGDSEAYVEQAGGRLVDVRHEDFDVLVLGDDAGFAFRESMDATLTRLIRRFDGDDPPTLVLPNPDLIYQQGPDAFGFAVGSLANMFETVLAERFPAVAPRFERLGKPHPPIYREALRRAESDNVAMLGDQLATDIDGANRAGLDSVFVPGGVTNLEAALSETDVHPDWVLRQLDPNADA